MTVPLFLASEVPAVGEPTVLTGAEGHHAADVQRVRRGEQVLLSDGRGTVATTEVTAVARGEATLRVDQVRAVPVSAPRLVVAQALSKGDRAELAVQAMTEVGVDEIVPWPASRSVVRWRGARGERAWQRWQTTAREATKQSRRAWIPEVAPSTSTAALADRLGHAEALVLHEQAQASLTAAALPQPGTATDLVLVIGPEGGIAPAEVEAFTAAGARTVRMGEPLLRVSTAPVAALAVLNARLGRW